MEATESKTDKSLCINKIENQNDIRLTKPKIDINAFIDNLDNLDFDPKQFPCIYKERCKFKFKIFNNGMRFEKSISFIKKSFIYTNL